MKQEGEERLQWERLKEHGGGRGRRDFFIYYFFFLGLSKTTTICLRFFIFYILL
jgi:hypothetical protein